MAVVRVIARKRTLAKARRALVSMYGPRPFVSRGSAIDVLVEATLSQNTHKANSTRGYRMLRRRFSTWTKVMLAPVRDVQREIAICGLARMRAHRLQAMLRRIKQERGRLDLEWLADEPPDSAFDYLTSFHGVGPKTAALVLLFAFNGAILPVDNGVLRVARRLKLVRPKARDLETQTTLSPLIPNGQHHAMHVLMYEHAKQRCRPRNPKCDECKLLSLCPFGQRRLKHRPPEQVDVPTLPVKTRKQILARIISAGIPKRASPDAEAPPEP